VLSTTGLYFYNNVDHTVAQAFNMLRLIRYITSSSAVNTLIALSCAVVRSKIEFASVVWNFVTLPDFYKIEKVQKKCYLVLH
jgi:hypothetical protein